MSAGMKDTIAAIATAPGEGAIGIVRVSGPAAIAITEIGFRGRAPLSDAPGYTVHHGRLFDAHGEEIDEVLVTLFRSPHSYTGEDAVEINCHGGLIQTRRVLDTILGLGARPAAPGEFTKRAFLNGRIDLSQAEAVAALIAARSRRAARASLEQLEGRLSSRVGSIRDGLLDLAGTLELELDFTEEGLDLATRQALVQKLETARNPIRDLIASYGSGKIIRDGVSVVIGGKPNAGKSSLFNALLRSDRAIVTPLPGTTRDSIEEALEIGGIQFRLTDTAGLHDAADTIEAEGIRRAKVAQSRADILLMVHDLTDESPPLEPPPVDPSRRIVHVWNKSDLVPDRPPRSVDLAVSARTGEGMTELKAALTEAAVGEPGSILESGLVTMARHAEALTLAEAALHRALDSLRSGLGNELVAFEVRDATKRLSEITGEVATDDVLNAIFAHFCIGK